MMDGRMLDLPEVLGRAGGLNAKPSVLVVDDEPQVLQAMQDVLGDEFAIITAGSGEQGLECMRSQRDIAVVISDQRMPLMTGDSFLEKVGLISRATRILFTGFADLSAVIRAVNHGRIFAYLTKPWNADNVRMTVHQAAEQFGLAAELAHERRLLSDLMNSAPDAIYFKDRALRYVKVNHACASLFERDDPDSMRGQSLLELGPSNQELASQLEEGQHALLADGEVMLDRVSSFERTGRIRYLSTTNAPIRGDNGEIVGLVGISRDITERMEREAEISRQATQLSFLAQYDKLTNLPKRELLLDRLALQLTAASSAHTGLALVLIDIDRFRRINESLGRSAGDELLTALVERLRLHVGPADTLARFDGNTFAWLMPLEANAARIAAKIEGALLPALRAPFTIHGTELRLSCRIAIALGPSDGSDAETLARNAEAALHRSQASGQSYVFYAPSMNEKVAEKLALETRLRRAIEAGEFVLYYQPKVALKTGLIVGLEALIRWQDPEHGLISPAAFIPVLEETGLILDVGRWVLRSAAEQYTRWTEQGLNPPPIAVNVSAQELSNSDFLRSIEHTAGDFPLADGGLDLEITESVLMSDMAGNVEKLHSVRERGLRVAIDDFGTGYSSLGYLSRLPIDALKVDRSFVSRMTDDPQDMTIVMTIISLAHALDLKVIAEGSETMQQAQLLRLLKCDQMQGYLVARPAPADHIVHLLGKTLRFESGSLAPTMA
jgi:diguanylate cyclase (GGDEF)-like protein/PAS domain S-box-containing protein